MRGSSAPRRPSDGPVLRRPVALGVALIVAWWSVQLLVANGLPRLAPPWFPDLAPTLVNLGALLVPLAVVAAFGWWRQAGLAPPRPDRFWDSGRPLYEGVATPAGRLAKIGVCDYG